MEILQEASSLTKKTFISHVFSMTEDSNAEVLNVIQYALMGIIPIVLLNKSIQRFIPEADPDNSSIEILAEVAIQTVVMFVGIIMVHRFITFIPTYSGFKYEHLHLTNVILAFLIIVLSIQTKLGMKVNILFDRILELWNGPSYENMENKKNVKVSKPVSQHNTSQADYLGNNNIQDGSFPPAPVATTRQSSNMDNYDNMMGGGGNSFQNAAPEPMAANSAVGGFGSF
tara:strand:- start:4272 stop:4955 length:684 start_codon:yes stop_codon:yes gene_type:complete